MQNRLRLSVVPQKHISHIICANSKLTIPILLASGKETKIILKAIKLHVSKATNSGTVFFELSAALCPR